MNIKLVQAPTTEPVSLADMKLYLRVDLNDEDALITSLIKTAREHVETFTRRAIPSQQWALYLDKFPAKEIVIPKPPLFSVQSITYKDKDGVKATFPTTDYIVDGESDPGKIVPAYGKTFPSIEFYPVNAVKVSFTAGYSTIPEVYVIAIKMLVAHFYEKRQLVSETSMTEIPFGIKNLLYPHRKAWSHLERRHDFEGPECLCHVEIFLY
nr:hypothetical protein 1 [bacterium]